MELALLVWMVSWLNPLGFLICMSAIFMVVASITAKLAYTCDNNPAVVETAKKFMYFKTSIFLLVLSIIIPNEKTAQYMAGAYLIQSSYESDFVQKATPLAQQAILNQLKTWAKDNKELDVLVGQMEVVNNVNPK
jgi:hypothetical protein